MRKSRGRGIIVGRRCPQIQLCPACGRMKVHHPPGRECPVPVEVTEALRQFKAEHGRTWKSCLRLLWESGQFYSTEIQQARNLIGPTRIEKIKLNPTQEK